MWEGGSGLIPRRGGMIGTDVGRGLWRDGRWLEVDRISCKKRVQGEGRTATKPDRRGKVALENYDISR